MSGPYRREQTADDGICWSNRWSPSLARCAKPGIYGNPNSRNVFDRVSRWCEDHRFNGDVLVAACPTGEPEGERDA